MNFRKHIFRLIALAAIVVSSDLMAARLLWSFVVPGLQASAPRISRDGALLAVTDKSRRELLLYELASDSARLVRKISLSHTPTVAEFSADGSQVFVGTQDGSVLIVATRSANEPTSVLQSLRQGRPADAIASIEVPGGVESGVVITGQLNQDLTVFDYSGGERRHTFHTWVSGTPRRLPIAIDREGFFASSADEYGRIHLWNLVTGKELFRDQNVFYENASSVPFGSLHFADSHLIGVRGPLDAPEIYRIDAESGLGDFLAFPKEALSMGSDTGATACETVHCDRVRFSSEGSAALAAVVVSEPVPPKAPKEKRRVIVSMRKSDVCAFLLSFGSSPFITRLPSPSLSASETDVAIDSKSKRGIVVAGDPSRGTEISYWSF